MNGMTYNTKQIQQQGNTLMLVMVVVLALLTVTFGGLAIYLNTQYQAKSTDVNGQIERAVLEGKNEQQEEDDKKFADREKEPNKQFIGPDDYGRLTFSYPKTWSAYVDTDVSRGGKYEAYLNPGVVPPVTSKEQFALRVLIEEKDYDKVVDQYASLVKKGDLRNSSTSSEGNIGTRLDGNFNKDIRGSAVIYKLRDKTITLRTDADTFKPDFENIIKTISFNQ
jgi:hypothetical protein